MAWPATGESASLAGRALDRVEARAALETTNKAKA